MGNGISPVNRQLEWRSEMETIYKIYVDNSVAPVTLTGEFIELDSRNAGNPAHTSGIFRTRSGKVGIIAYDIDSEPYRRFISTENILPNAWYPYHGDGRDILKRLQKISEPHPA
jgi:hypothetical protein